MIKFADFMPVDFPDKTKVKFNMNADNPAYMRGTICWMMLLNGILRFKASLEEKTACLRSQFVISK